MRRTVQILACLLLLLGWHPVATWAQAPVLDEANAFVTRWQGEAGKDIQVPLYGSYAYRWEKADGTEVAGGVATVAEEGLLELPVAEAGEYVLRAGPGGVKRIEFGVLGGWYGSSRGTPGALLRVEQWGKVKWVSFAGAFYGCANMSVAEGAGKPDLSGVASMHSAFEGCASFNSPIGDWDVSRVTSMREMFSSCSAFNQPLGAWDVSKVTSMGGMFYKCKSFNQPLERWDVSRVENMGDMFYKCSAFNQPLERWDVSNVTNMEGMFPVCVSFNQPLEQWDVSKVTNMKSMFSGCLAFNQPLGAWDVSKVTNMMGMFYGCTSFNQPLEQWDVSNVTDMWGMFSGCSSFNQPLEQWDVSQVTSMWGMFEGCSSFNQPLEGWDVSQVTSMGGMFEGCSSFNQPLEGWDVSRVTSMELMFRGCSAFNQPLGGWTLSALKRNEGRDHDLGFQGSGLDATNYSSTLVAWAAKRDQLKDGVKVAAAGLKYDAVSKSVRQQLIDGKAWVFKDDSEATVASPAVEIVGAPTWLAVGATHAFSAKVVPAEAPQAVTWSVEGDGAAFTGNVLKVTKEGIITVTATSEAVATSKRSVKIRVTAPVALTGITVSPVSAQLEIGGTQTLTVGYTPEDATNKSVTWSSSDASVATVDAAGVVTAKGEGTATITATAADGGHTATCTVTVTAPIALTGIAVSPTSAQLGVGGTQQLTVGYTPADATNRAVTWSSSDASVATVDAQGKVTGVKAGTATITVTSVDGGHTATCSVTVVADEKPSGVESAALAGVSVSPNPFGDHLTVRGAEGVLRYSLVNGSGVVVLEGAHAGGDELGLSTSHLPAGIYWLRLVAADGERVVQVVRR